MKAGLFAAGAAVVINVVLFFIFHSAGIFTDDIMIQPGQSLTVLPVIMSSILPTLIGAIIFFLIEKYTSNGFRIFSILAIAFLLLSFISPFTMIPGVTVGYALALNVLHIVVAGSLLYFLKNAVSAIRK